MRMRQLSIAAVFCSLLYGQGTNGAFTGVVIDPTGAVIAGAAVTLNNIATGIAAHSITNGTGVYSVPSLPVGSYEIRIEASGFKAYVRTGLGLETAQTVRVDARLEVGAASETVTIRAEAPLLQQETSSVGTQISNNLVNGLPFQLTGGMRNPFAFIRLTPGATGQSGAGDGTRIAGGRTHASEVFVDGVPIIYRADQSVAGPAAPPVDTVAEFRVESVVPPAEYGRTSSGVVLVTSRSGTNELHGNLFLLLRNNVLDARRYNASIADITRQGEFGGGVGGPVILPKLYDGRSRSFFFFNYTGFQRLNGVQGRLATLSTEAMRAGDFSGVTQRIFDPLTAAANGQRQQFAANRIPANRLSPFAKAINAVAPLPNLPGISNNYSSALPSINTINTYFARFDHAWSSNHRMNLAARPRIEGRDNNGVLPNFIDRTFQPLYTVNATASDDLVIRPNLVNHFQLGYTRFFAEVSRSLDIGVKVPGAFEGGFPGVRFAGQGFTAIGAGDDRFNTANNYNLTEGLSWTKGRHNLKFGARIDAYRHSVFTLGFREGAYTFSQFGTSQPQSAGTGHSFASYMLGMVNNATMALGLPFGYRSRYHGFYAQDDWKITNRLTLNYGIRYEFQTPFSEQYGRISRMDRSLPNRAAGGLPGALVFGGDGPGRSGQNTFFQTYRAGLGPRFGLAYRIASNTVVRAGYGMFYAGLIGFDSDNQGFGANVNVTSQDGGLTSAFLIDQGWPAGVVRFPPFIDPTGSNDQGTTTSNSSRGQGARLPRTSQWQFSLQQTVHNILIEATYAGTVSHGITNDALERVNQLNPSYLALGQLLTRNITDAAVAAAGFRPPYAGFRGSLAQALRAFPQYQDITTTDSPTGNSSYHALFLKTEKRFSHGLQFLASFAYTKNLTDVTFQSGALSAPQDQFNRRAEKSISDVDVPQRLTVSYIYELPVGPGKPLLSRGVLSVLAGGWSIAGIHSFDRGGPLRITTTNGLPLFGGSLRPNRVGSVPIRTASTGNGFRPFNLLSGEQGDMYLNRDAFAAPAPFTLGNLGVFLPDVRGFSSFSEDFSLFRRVRFLEKHSVEIRADFFNAFNRRNLSDPVTDLTNPSFGRITGQGSARIIQLGMRMDW
ncbi:MAG: TonB-dependent receptor [Candidatus Solibacter usitatus]|nr:TonB-dependent receptor [Candidatus Solibacter usitatus]